jgi:hypothetical protein
VNEFLPLSGSSTICIDATNVAGSESRRTALKAMAGLAATALVFPVWGTSPSPIIVDTSTVTDVPSLLRAIKNAGASVLPSSTPDHLILRALAQEFAKHSRDIVEKLKIPIPEEIRSRISYSLSTRLSSDAIAAGVLVTILGVVFLIPTIVLATAVIASLAVMTAYIVQAVKDLESDRTRGTSLK